MSKESDLRAMREARFNARRSGPATTPIPAKPAARPAKAPKVQKFQEPQEVAATDGLCGHRSMNGRTCTREHGHQAKSHRYS